MATQCCGQQTYGRADRPKRMQLIDDIKMLIENIDNAERAGKTKAACGRAGAPGNTGDPVLERQCREYRRRRGCSPPVITSIATHEFRPTADFTRMRHENTSQVTYVDATREPGAARLDPMPPAPWELPRTASQELRAGVLYQSCECRRRNGLQQDCPRWECGGREECLAVNPGPCCPPSKARKPVRGDRRQKQTPARPEQGADVTGQSAGTGREPGLVVPIIVRVGGQGQQGGQSPNAPARTYLCEAPPHPGAAKIPEMPAPATFPRDRYQPQCHSADEGAGKITAMPGPHGWPAGGRGPPQAHLFEPQGGQGAPQTARGPVLLQGPGVACLCRTVPTPQPQPQASAYVLYQPKPSLCMIGPLTPGHQ